jgi:hypothetical protein
VLLSVRLITLFLLIALVLRMLGLFTYSFLFRGVGVGIRLFYEQGNLQGVLYMVILGLTIYLVRLRLRYRFFRGKLHLFSSRKYVWAYLTGFLWGPVVFVFFNILEILFVLLGGK